MVRFAALEDDVIDEVIRIRRGEQGLPKVDTRPRLIRVLTQVHDRVGPGRRGKQGEGTAAARGRRRAPSTSSAKTGGSSIGHSSAPPQGR